MPAMTDRGLVSLSPIGTEQQLLDSSIDLGVGAAAIQASAALHQRIFAAPQDETEAAIMAVAAALRHPVLRRAAAADDPSIRRETPILMTMLDGTLAEGALDLVFREQDTDFDGWTVVDFKTDQDSRPKPTITSRRSASTRGRCRRPPVCRPGALS